MEPGIKEDAVAVWAALAATYPTELALARKSGLHLSPKTQEKSLPASENAAPLYRQMGTIKGGPAAASSQTATLLSFLDLRSPTPSQIQQAQQAAKSCSDLHLVHQATALSHCDFKRVPDTPAPELAALRQAARLLLAESLLLAWQGQAQQAFENQALSFRVVRHAAAGNMLIDWLIAIAVDAIGLAGMARILTLGQGEAVTATSIAKVLQQQWRPLAFAPVIAAETAWQHQEMTRMRQRGFMPYLLHSVDEMLAPYPGATKAETAEMEQGRQQARAEMEGMLRPATLHTLRTNKATETLLLDATDAFMLRWMRKLHAAADLPYWQAAPIFADFRRDLATSPSMPDGPKAIRLIPGFLLGTLNAPLETKAYETARAATLLAATHLLARSPRRGALPFPDTIADLPLDPFTGSLLRYRKEGMGFVIFSVGPKGDFDGGRPGTPLVGQKRSLLFRYSPGAAG